MPGYVPPTRLEGNYSTWTVYDSFSDADVDASKGYQGAIINKLETIILIFDYASGSLKAKYYTIATKTLTVLSGTDHDAPPMFIQPGWYSPNSVQGTYAVAIIFNRDGIRIYKNGVVAKSLTYAELGIDSGKVYSVDISPSGKYVIVSGYITALSSYGWVVLVGS